jgi:hypothetical protein
MTKAAVLTIALYICFVIGVSAESSGRWFIEVYDFSVEVQGIDKEEAANVLTNKIKRFSEQVVAQCSDLSKDLVNVDRLAVEKKGKPFTSFRPMAEFWHKDVLVLEIIDGSIAKYFSKVSSATTMLSDVHLFDLKGSLKEPTVTICTEMTGANLGPVGDLHCAVALYALAMDLKLRYLSVKDAKEKQSYISIINRYLGKIPEYLPQPKDAPNEMDKRQEELANQLLEAAQQELKWCKEEDGKL